MRMPGKHSTKTLHLRSSCRTFSFLTWDTHPDFLCAFSYLANDMLESNFPGLTGRFDGVSKVKKNGMGLNPCMVTGITFASMPPDFPILVKGKKRSKMFPANHILIVRIGHCICAAFSSTL
jgi:hypothetical protein